jgi:hypothetical protein
VGAGSDGRCQAADGTGVRAFAVGRLPLRRRRSRPAQICADALLAACQLRRPLTRDARRIERARAAPRARCRRTAGPAHAFGGLHAPVDGGGAGRSPHEHGQQRRHEEVMVVRQHRANLGRLSRDRLHLRARSQQWVVPVATQISSDGHTSVWLLIVSRQL